jgi:hypothetical protein
LRNPFTGKGRLPTKDEYKEIQQHVPECTGYNQICGPILVLQCPNPPKTAPLTIGGLPTILVPDLRDYDDVGGMPGNPMLPNFAEIDDFIDDGWEIDDV